MTDPGDQQHDDAAEALDPAAAIRDILDEARRVSGGGPRFAAKLEALGIGPETGRYSESAISNWIRGRTMPPADVLLAAALMTGISVDEHLLTSRKPTTTSDPESLDLADVIARLQADIDGLRSDMIELYGRLGFPMPRREGRPADGVSSPPAAATG